MTLCIPLAPVLQVECVVFLLLVVSVGVLLLVQVVWVRVVVRVFRPL